MANLEAAWCHYLPVPVQIGLCLMVSGGGGRSSTTVSSGRCLFFFSLELVALTVKCPTDSELVLVDGTVGLKRAAPNEKVLFVPKIQSISTTETCYHLALTDMLFVPPPIPTRFGPR